MDRMMDEHYVQLTLRYSSPSFPRRLETSIIRTAKRRGIGQFYGTAFPFPVLTRMALYGNGECRNYPHDLVRHLCFRVFADVVDLPHAEVFLQLHG